MVKHHDVVGRYVTIEVDDCEYKVFYLQNGKGIPLICQHTAGCHNHQWRGLLEDPEITKNYNVIALAHSDKDSTMTWVSENLVGELEIGFSTPELRDNLKIIGQPISVIFDTDGTILLREYGYVASDL